MNRNNESERFYQIADQVYNSYHSKLENSNFKESQFSGDSPKRIKRFYKGQIFFRFSLLLIFILLYMYFFR